MFLRRFQPLLAHASILIRRKPPFFRFSAFIPAHGTLRNLASPKNQIASIFSCDMPNPGTRRWLLLLVVPYIALLWSPSYARLSPALWGVPFFYWYQFAWIPLSAFITVLVYRKTR